MTVVNVRGTSGSGKSTVAFKLMEAADRVEPIPGPQFSSRSQRQTKPIGYWLHFRELARPVYLLGPYGTQCGGADTFNCMFSIFEKVWREADAGNHVFFEGLLVSRSKGRMIDLWGKVGKESSGMKSFHLMTTLDECLDSIRARRAAKNNPKPLNTDQTSATFERVLKISRDFHKDGYPIKFVSRDEVLGEVLRAFGLTERAENVCSNSPACA